jgi:hypothetical protein
MRTGMGAFCIAERHVADMIRAASTRFVERDFVKCRIQLHFKHFGVNIHTNLVFKSLT